MTGLVARSFHWTGSAGSCAVPVPADGFSCVLAAVGGLPGGGAGPASLLAAAIPSRLSRPSCFSPFVPNSPGTEPDEAAGQSGTIPAHSGSNKARCQCGARGQSSQFFSAAAAMIQGCRALLLTSLLNATSNRHEISALFRSASKVLRPCGLGDRGYCWKEEEVGFAVMGTGDGGWGRWGPGSFSAGAGAEEIVPIRTNSTRTKTLQDNHAKKRSVSPA